MSPSTLCVKPDKVKIFRDSASLYALEDPVGTVAYFTQLATVRLEDIYSASTMGHRFTTNDNMDIALPKKLIRSCELPDFIVGLLKVRGGVDYWYGIPVDNGNRTQH